MSESPSTTKSSQRSETDEEPESRNQRDTDALLNQIVAEDAGEAAEATPPVVAVAAVTAAAVVPGSLADETVFVEQLRGLQLEDYRQDIAFRKGFAKHLFYMVVGWLFFDALILALSGWQRPYGFQLPENVLLALIGGTTAGVIGMFVVVVKYVFPEKKP